MVGAEEQRLGHVTSESSYSIACHLSPRHRQSLHPALARSSCGGRGRGVGAARGWGGDAEVRRHFSVTTEEARRSEWDTWSGSLGDRAQSSRAVAEDAASAIKEATSGSSHASRSASLTRLMMGRPLVLKLVLMSSGSPEATPGPRARSRSPRPELASETEDSDTDMWVAQWAYTRKGGNELSIRVGDRMRVLSKRDRDWWRVRRWRHQG